MHQIKVKAKQPKLLINYKGNDKNTWDKVKLTEMFDINNFILLGNDLFLFFYLFIYTWVRTKK